MRMDRKAGLIAATLLTAAAVAGCSRSAASHQSSQVVATVNDQEITVSQLNQTLRAAKVDEVTPEVTRQAVDALVTEELLVQDALRNKMDRDPAVVQALEHARRKVLAEAFAEKRLFVAAAPTNQQIEAYYQQTPALFANRKLYRFTTFSATKSDITDGVRTELDGAHSIDQVRAVLEKHALPYAVTISTVSPEQVPLAQLSAFANASIGDLLISDAGANKLNLMCLTAAENNPIGLEQATPMIREYLTNASHQEALAAYIKQTKAAARIAYTKPPQPRVVPAPDTGGTAAAPGNAPAQAPPVTRNDPAGKGAAGLN